MRILLTIILFLLISVLLRGQSIWKDTLKTSVNLKNFRLSNKVVQADYGKVVMYFNQADYLKTKVSADTVRVTPKYFSDEVIVDLLKKGRVKIIKRSDKTIESKIIHYLKQCGSTCDRIFELKNGVQFFGNLEIIGIMDTVTLIAEEHYKRWCLLLNDCCK